MPESELNENLPRPVLSVAAATAALTTVQASLTKAEEAVVACELVASADCAVQKRMQALTQIELLKSQKDRES